MTQRRDPMHVMVQVILAVALVAAVAMLVHSHWQLTQRITAIEADQASVIEGVQDAQSEARAVSNRVDKLETAPKAEPKIGGRRGAP